MRPAAPGLAAQVIRAEWRDVIFRAMAAAMTSESLFKPVLRGLSRRCPACGKGHLFDGYLKLRPVCSECGAAWDHEKAADGPAWLTVLLLGPVFAPLIFLASLKAEKLVWLVFPLLATLMIAMALGLLALMKGAWLGALWHMDQTRDKI